MSEAKNTTENGVAERMAEERLDFKSSARLHDRQTAPSNFA